MADICAELGTSVAAKSLRHHCYFMLRAQFQVGAVGRLRLVRWCRCTRTCVLMHALCAVQAFTDARAEFNKCPYNDVAAMKRVLVKLQGQLLAEEAATGKVRARVCAVCASLVVPRSF